MKPDIKSYTVEELEAQFQDWGQPKYRVAQLLDWLYGRRATAWDAMTNLPATLRDLLAQQYSLGALALVAKRGASDATGKFLWRLADGALIESVLVPASPALFGEPSDRHTLCVSTQVGCAYGCKFCASGLDGWKRNLQAAEIVEQVLAVERWHAQTNSESPLSCPESPGPPSESARLKPRSERLVSNLVIMGMGEPLANYEHLRRALQILNAPWGGGIGARKITISTAGLAPQIRRLAQEPFQFRLAISLHGATDELRNRLMPVNRKYPLRELIAACEYYAAQKGRMISLEYILIDGVNDDIEQARLLAGLARRLHARVNLIPYNPAPGLPWQRATEAAQMAFLQAIEARQVPVTLRREKGLDIDAACGQLRLRTLADRAESEPIR